MTDTPITQNWGTLREPRQGIMLHYVGPGTDAGAVHWLKYDTTARVSYNWLILDNGAQHTVAPSEARAWHAGVCKPSCPEFTYRDANSAFYGIAAAAHPKERVTPLAFLTIVQLCRALCRRHGWTERWRITGHDREAWHRGRKIDPTGPDPRLPVLELAAVIRAVFP